MIFILLVSWAMKSIRVIPVLQVGIDEERILNERMIQACRNDNSHIKFLMAN